MLIDCGNLNYRTGGGEFALYPDKKGLLFSSEQYFFKFSYCSWSKNFYNDFQI